VETGEGRIPNLATDLHKLIPELLDHLIELGEISRQIKLTIGDNGSSNSENLHINTATGLKYVNSKNAY
jgi:hypothetical protein